MQTKKKEYLDTKYIIQLQNGDVEAFDVIFSYYKKHIYWMGYNYFSNDEEAKDLVQSVFLEIYQSINKLKDPEKFYAWMNRIAYSRCLLMLRYEMKDSLHYSNDMQEEYVENSIEDKNSEDVITKIQKEQVMDIIVEEIKNLSPKYRTICYLRFFEELSYAEISEIMSVPLGTITNYIGRLKPKLQKALQKNGITSASCLSLIVFPNIVGYFKAYMDMGSAPLNMEASSIFATGATPIIAKSVVKNTWSILAYGLVGTAAGAAIVVTLVGRDNIPFIRPTDLNHAVIERIEYPEELRNTPLTLEVETSNSNYDQMLIDDKQTLTIRKNGTYIVRLIKDGLEIDREEITITNIDRDVPEVIEENILDDVIIFKIIDPDSGINFSGISLTKGNKTYHDMVINQETGQITVNITDLSKYQLNVPDFAGNINRIIIDVFEESKRGK